MSSLRVVIRTDSDDELLINQNFAKGWVARWHTRDGSVEALPAARSREGLISVEVYPNVTQIELRYAPASFTYGATITLVSAGACVVVLLVGAMRRRRRGRG